MKVNKELMSQARFEKKQIGELTVKEFRTLMQECFDADRTELQKRANEEFARRQRGYMPNVELTSRASRGLG